ncbi:hypothetical protein [Sinorhizobium meliloti]|uniref:hypothetical protein n=1 Tax=Rhizobium meliloti TaxID=382 RepID=UPI000B49807B|nr:hypothetical protein [Sinorhizobium meliloti]ASP51474.1 hypothetical protein CDO31_07755 [Sinorhizobium meliloti]
MSTMFPGKVRLHKQDLIDARVAGSTWELHRMIEDGLIRPPHKRGPHQQSRVFWWPDEVAEDVERIREQRLLEQKRKQSI